MAKVLEILKPEYMSSEESEADDEPPHKIIKYSVRKLPWESRSLRKAKRKLDRLHHDSLSELIKRRVVPRETGEPSTRRNPINCPDWAAAVAEPEEDNAVQAVDGSGVSSSDNADSSFNDSF